MKLLVVCRSVQRSSVSLMPKSSYVTDMVSVQGLQGVSAAYHHPRGKMSWNRVPAAVRRGRPVLQCGLGEPGWAFCRAWLALQIVFGICYRAKLPAPQDVTIPSSVLPATSAESMNTQPSMPSGWGLLPAQGNPHLAEPLNIAVNTDSK